MPFYVYIASGCFHTRTKELNSCYRNHRSQKARKYCYMEFYRNVCQSLPYKIDAIYYQLQFINDEADAMRG